MAKRNKTRLPFFDFDQRLISKKAKEYHHEVRHLTLDLMETHRKAARTLLLCERTAKGLTAGNIFVSQRDAMDFNALTYHLENFWLRGYAYREKICQLINKVLDLKFSDRSALFQKLSEDTIVRRSGLKHELEKFSKDSILHGVLIKRKMITHRIYYEQAISGYDRRLKPLSDQKRGVKPWIENMRKEVKLTEKFINKAMKLNDVIMQKLIAYKKTHKS